MHKVSIVLPAYKEAGNILVLGDALHRVLSDHHGAYEIIIVDDHSQDGTEEQVAQLKMQGVSVDLLVRRDQKGLSSAVLQGIAIAQGDIVVVMDADLSHPCAVIPQMVQMLADQQADFVIGSRYVAGGSLDQSWGRLRVLNSRIATWLSTLLVQVQDPMSGFFAFRRKDMPPAHVLSPIGYKIGLELLVKGRKKFCRVSEIPIHFRNRQYGNSKMSMAEQIRYVRHLRRLYAYAYPTLSEVMQFAMVGSVGFMVDLLLYLSLQTVFGLSHILARGFAFWGAASSNWILNRMLTFSSYQKTPKLQQWLLFLLASCIGFAISWGSYTLLTLYVTFFMQHKIIALFLGVVLGMASNFVFCQNVVFKPLHQREDDA